MTELKQATRMASLGALALLAACAARPIEAPVESLTVARVMGQDVEVPPLLPQVGSVWPAGEGPRGVIGNPDAGLRPGQPEPTAGQRRGSGTPPEMPRIYDAAPPVQPTGAPVAPSYPPLARPGGRVIPTPQGAVVTSGGIPGQATYTTPEGASGIAIPQGATTTLLQDGTVRQVPTPR